MLGSNLGVLSCFPTPKGVITYRLLALIQEKQHNGAYRNTFCPHQSLCHGGLVLPRKVLLQGQDDTVGSDGGQDHVLEWCMGRKVKESTSTPTKRDKTNA